MSWNNGYERRKFEAEQKKQAEEYRALGMSEEKIQAMYEFDLAQFNSKRRYYMHTQEFSTSDFDEGENDESESTLLHKFFEQLTVTIENCGDRSRYWWVDEIDNPILVKGIKSLSQDDIELITLLVFENYRKSEIAKMLGCEPYHITRRLVRIKEQLRG